MRDQSGHWAGTLRMPGISGSPLAKKFHFFIIFALLP
jgi:hypothetical protein